MNNQCKISNIFDETGVFSGLYLRLECTDGPGFLYDSMILWQISLIWYAAEEGSRIVVSGQDNQQCLACRADSTYSSPLIAMRWPESVSQIARISLYSSLDIPPAPSAVSSLISSSTSMESAGLRDDWLGDSAVCSAISTRCDSGLS